MSGIVMGLYVAISFQLYHKSVRMVRFFSFYKVIWLYKMSLDQNSRPECSLEVKTSNCQVLKPLVQHSCLKAFKAHKRTEMHKVISDCDSKMRFLF